MITNPWGWLAVVIVAFAGMLPGQEKTPLRNHEFFHKLTGKWEAAGELKGADGKVQPYKAEWSGVIAEDGSFVAEGTREIGTTTQQYRWVYAPASAEGLFEVMHELPNENGNAQRFEASYFPAALTFEMTAFLGSGGSKVTVKERFSGENAETLVTEVEFADDQGQVTLSGTIINRRVKSP